MTGNKTVYGVKHKDENIRSASRSGGVFTALSDMIIDNGGVVYGCALDEHFNAVHKRAITKEQRNEFRGSKYVQSKIGNIYNLVSIDLNNGLDVLFSGTPCQVHGLLNYLKVKKIDTKTLITVDILCHGVPSPKIWADYLRNKFDISEIDKVEFRDKKNFGWRDCVETITVDGKNISSKEFSNSFYSHLIVRRSCFNCYYKKTERISDITIGDYWKIENIDKNFDDNKGVSLVMINTDKGSSFFKSCEKQLIIKEFLLSMSIQPVLDGNYIEPENREKFWNEYNGKNLAELTQKYTGYTEPSLIKRVLIKLIGLALKVLKR